MKNVFYKIEIVNDPVTFIDSNRFKRQHYE